MPRTRSSQPRALFLPGWRAEGALGGNTTSPFTKPHRGARLSPGAAALWGFSYGQDGAGRFGATFLRFKPQQMPFLETRMDL